LAQYGPDLKYAASTNDYFGQMARVLLSRYNEKIAKGIIEQKA